MISEEFERVWPLLAPAVAAEIGGSGFSKEMILQNIENENLVLWSSENAACLTEINVMETRKTLHVWVVGGKLKELLEVIYPQLERYARYTDCQYITGSGRESWGRVLKKLGFAPAYTTFAKELK